MVTFKASFCSNTRPNNGAKWNLLVCQRSSKVLLDVRVHYRPEVEILDVSEQVDDEYLDEREGMRVLWRPRSYPQQNTELLLPHGVADCQCLPQCSPRAVDVRFPLCVWASVLSILSLPSLDSQTRLEAHLSVPLLLWAFIGSVNIMVSQKPWKRKRKKIVLGARLAYERLCPSEMGRAGQGSEEEEEPKGANYASAIPTLTSAPHLSGRLGVSRSPWIYSTTVGLAILSKMH